VIDSLAPRFHALFAGLERAHGIYFKLDSEREDGKLTCTRKPDTLVDPVTDALWLEHLTGGNGLGIVPIREDSTAMFGAIDIDVYDGLSHAAIAATLVELNLPLIPCRSKSGGCHVCLFTSVPVSAGAMQAKLSEIAAMIGHGTAEIFPKQTALADNDFGSWINMPYYAGEATTRYGVRPDGEPLSMEQFLETAARVAVGPGFFKPVSAKEAKEKETFPNGPPCLNHLAKIGVPVSGGNTALFNIAIYNKKSMPSGWEDATATANQSILTEPRTLQELNDIVKSLGKKDYGYQCKQEPLKAYCNSTKCQLRTFGVGSGNFPSLGELRKLDIDPPVYFWDMTIGGKQITIELTAAQVQDPREFKKRVWQKANLSIPPVKQEVWDKTLNALEPEGKLQIIYVPEDASTEGQVWELIEQYCTRNEANSKDEILLGRPWTDSGRTYFRLLDLMRFLGSQQFKEYKVYQLAKVLKGNKKVEHTVEHQGEGFKSMVTPGVCQADSGLRCSRLDQE